MTMMLRGRTAIVTGAARGIGFAIARELAAHGATVVLSDIDAAEGKIATTELKRGGFQATFVAADVSRPDDCEMLAAEAAATTGGLHILVNNAGLMSRAMVHRMSDEAWNTSVDVVLRGTFNCIRAVAPWFRSGDAPRRIVNLSSVAGIYGNLGSANYAAAKAGVIGLTKTVAHEWARFSVTVNAVAPGFVETRMTESVPHPTSAYGTTSDIHDRFVALIPVGRAGTPEDVAAGVCYLCSPSAGFVTGHVLEINGGLTLSAVPSANLST